MNSGKIKSIVESLMFERFITLVIIMNAVILGFETAPNLSKNVINIFNILDNIFLAIFTVEILAKIGVYKRKFFSDPWRIFDFVIVFFSLLPSSGSFSVLRSLRVLRTLRMISVVPSLKRVVNGLLVALPGLGAVIVIIVLIFYVGAVMATKMFGQDFPHWFGSLWTSAYSLFQIMTLESWSMGIVRPVMQRFPYSWMFFIPFILITTFTMLNLFIAVIVNAMQVETDKNANKREEQGHEERIQIYEEIKKINLRLEKISKDKDSQE